MNNHPTNHPDALIDRGLAELIGGETPPDLCERILAAHTATPAPVTLAGSTAKQTSRLRTWALLAASIACVVTIAALLMPARNAARESNGLHRLAQQSMEYKLFAKSPPKDSIDAGGPKWTEELIASKPPTLSKTAKEQNWKDTIDTGIGLRDLINDTETPKSSEELMMAVTPHIIIEEGEEEVRLGFEQQSERPGIQPGDFFTPHVGRRFRNVGEAESQSDIDSPISPEHKAQMVNEYNELRRTQRYSEMEAVAKKIYDTDPNDPVAQQVWNHARFIRREITGDELKRLSEQDAQANYSHNSWAAIADRKKKFAAGDLSKRTKPESFSFNLGFERTSPTDHLYREHETLGWHPSRDQYTPIHENPFIKADGPDAVNTFSIDVDTASYANVRQFLEQSRQLPAADAVRIEELVNYFDYDYAGPTDGRPFAAHMEVASCPWNKDHRLARIAIKGKEIARDERPQSNLVFLVDVSGSMNEPNKLPLLVEGMKMLTRELGENDRVAIVVYASSEGLALESTRGDEQKTILTALDQLRAGGSTAGGAGINLAYQVALDNFIEGGTNRVILCTDGDFNVGVTDTAQLEQLAIEKAKTGVFLTVLGFGRGNLNDAMMEGISGKGNGNYHYVDNLTEARKVLVEEMAGTLVTIAKDVKIQVEFNPAKVAGYRLIGYENRMLKTEDFNDDKKDAGEIGAGHTVTALYEIIPAGQEVTPPSADPLKYQQPLAGLANETPKSAKPQAASNELLTLKLRYKLPDATQSTKLEFPITDKGESFADATDDFQFAAAVASFGMLLRHSQYQGETSFDAVQEIAQSASENDPHNYRGEFLDLVRIAKELTGGQTEERSTTEGP